MDIWEFIEKISKLWIIMEKISKLLIITEKMWMGCVVRLRGATAWCDCDPPEQVSIIISAEIGILTPPLCRKIPGKINRPVRKMRNEVLFSFAQVWY